MTNANTIFQLYEKYMELHRTTDEEDIPPEVIEEYLESKTTE